MNTLVVTLVTHEDTEIKCLTLKSHFRYLVVSSIFAEVLSLFFFL